MEDPKPELYALKRKRLELLQRRVELKASFGLLNYQPHAKQDTFHRSGDKLRRLFRAGNRTGKSTAGCAEDCAWMLGYRPWYPKSDPARTAGIPQGRPRKILTITTDWDKVDEIFTSERGTEGKVRKFIPASMVKSKKRNHSGAIDTMEFRDGSIWKFDTVKSFLANPQGSESSDWDAIHIDEPCPEDMWKAVSRGLVDRGGKAWFTLTPLKEVWINDLFFPNPRKKAKEQHDHVTARMNRENYHVVVASIYDNPHLSREAIKMYEDSLTMDERECRLFGKPLELVGMIYKQFEADRHILSKPPKGWKDFRTPPPDWPVYFAIDPHPQTPHAVLFCAVSPLGQLFFFEEIFLHCKIPTLCENIHKIVGPNYVPWVLCDPIAFIADPVAEVPNMAYAFAQHGVHVDRATKDPSTGILQVQAALATDNQLYFSPYLEETLFEFDRYCWNKENKPTDKDDHMMENLYRLILAQPTWVDGKGSSSAPIEDMEIAEADFGVDDLSFLDD